MGNRRDLRGKMFSRKSFVKADFTEIIAGPLPLFECSLKLLAFFLAFVAGFISAYSGVLLGVLLEADTWIYGFAASTIILLFLYIFARYGLSAPSGNFSFLIIFVIISAVALVPKAAPAALSAIAISGPIASIVGIAASIAITRSQLFVVVSSVLGLIICAVGGFSLDIYSPLAEYLGLIFGGCIALGFGTHMGRSARLKKTRYMMIHSLAISFFEWCSTSFKNSDLTLANFSKASLRHTDFSNATLTRTRWHEATFHQNTLKGTYLENPIILQLVTTLEGQDANFDRFDLRGVNLDGASLVGASFIGANLTNATLKGADLTNAKLTQTQLYGADLTGAILTGAFIQNWGISSNTIFNEVECEYVYMRLPTSQDPDPCRKPDNRNETFRPGDFNDFIAPIIRTLDAYQQQNSDPRNLIIPKTLDLYHYEGIDPSAAAIALQQLIENNPNASIEVRSIEGHGYQKIRIQAQVSDEANRSQLNASYFGHYNDLRTLTYPDLQTLFSSIKSKDNRIRNLEVMLMNALGSDRFYAETQQPNTATVLMLAANPRDTTRLRLGQEFQEIQDGLERSSRRDLFVLQQRLAVTPSRLRRALLELKPRIVHFSGHGDQGGPGETEDYSTTEGLLLENNQGNAQLVSGEALANLFGIFDDFVDCVVLNACFSEAQADAIVQHIPYVIGMNQAIGDQAAIEFSIGFYDGLLAGQSIETAYKLGCNAIQLQNIPGHLIPVLKRRDYHP